MSRRDRGRPRPRPSVRDSYGDARADRYADPYVEPRQRLDDRGSVRRHDRTTADRSTLDDRVAWAILPLRLFLGGTFVYAGLDKLIDPTFLRSAGPGSIAAQLEVFTRVSPIGLLVHLFGQPFPVAIGWLIALAEIAIGLGALLGLAFTLSAAGGAGLSFLFWLTASWATKPYYYGPDLPYAFAWLTLGFVGHGGRFTLEGRLPWARGDGYDDEASADRRLVLQAAILGAGAMAIAAVGGTLGAGLLRPRTALGSGGDGSTGDGSTGDAASPGPADSPFPAATSAGPSAGASGAPTTAPVSGTVIARVSQVTARHAVRFTVPRTGDPGVVLKLPDGSLVAYDTTCTHAGCEVEFDPSSSLLICPCHGATFDPAHDAEVLGGPTDQPLTRLPIKIDAATGRVVLQG